MSRIAFPTGLRPTIMTLIVATSPYMWESTMVVTLASIVALSAMYLTYLLQDYVLS